MLRQLMMLALFLPGLAAAQVPPQQGVADGFAVEIVASDFGVYTAGPLGIPRFHPTRVVPYTPGRGGFGWMVVVRTERSSLRWRETLTLPSPPATWGEPVPGVRRTFADGGRTVIQDFEGTPPPVLHQTWQIAPGDPRGPHRIVVTIEGAAPLAFDFEVQ